MTADGGRTPLALTDAEFRGFADFIRARYGVNLDAKKTLVESRLAADVARKGFASYGAYLEYAMHDPTQRALSALVGRVTTSHTYFMRESDHFAYFAETVLPWAFGRGGMRDLRVWSAGCATGEEPYALSMVIFQMAEHRREEGWDTVVLASDVSEAALKTAQRGVYSEDALASLPGGWKSRFFEPEGEGFLRVTPTLRKNVAFRKINLMDDFSFSGPMHAIFCRNVMIYFDADTKARLVEKLHGALLPGGTLFIGHSESLTALDTPFEYVQPSVYRKPL